MFFFNNYKYFVVVLVDCTGLELQHHKQIEFKEDHICSCHLTVLNQHSRLLEYCKDYFANTKEVG